MTPAPLAGLFSVGAAMAATGRALDWYRDGILGETITTEALLAEAAATPPGADGLVFLPYLAGERSPIWDPEARGVLAGLTLGARARATSRGRSSRHRRWPSVTSSAPMLAAGVRVTEMRVCGGPARSPFWNQVKADVTGFTVAVPAVLETAVLGSAILGATGVGAHDDLPAAIAAMTRIDDRIEPRTDLAADLRPTVRGVRELYPATAPVLRPLHGPASMTADGTGSAARSRLARPVVRVPDP